MKNTANNTREITIQVLKIKYKKAETNFCILDCKILENKEKPQSVGSAICCTGVFYDVHEKAIYTVKGVPTLSEYKTRNGQEKKEWQLKVSSAEKSSRMCIDGLRDYLIRNVPSIGKVKANALVDKFGDKLLEMISNAANRNIIANIAGGRAADMLLEWSKENKSNYELRKELYEVGLTEWQANKVFQFFKSGVREAIKRRCFELINVSGFGFKTVCNIADKFGIARSDPGRIDACIIYLLQQDTEQGHVLSFDENIITESCKMLEIPKDEIKTRIDILISSKKVFTEDTDILSSSTILPGGMGDKIDEAIQEIAKTGNAESIDGIEYTEDVSELKDMLGEYIDLEEICQ